MKSFENFKYEVLLGGDIQRSLESRGTITEKDEKTVYIIPGTGNKFWKFDD